MCFNQFLWLTNVKVMNKLLEENPSTDFKDDISYNSSPSTKVYIEKMDRILNEYKLLQEFIDPSSGHCNTSVFKSKHEHGLYMEAFCNGISTVLQQLNETFLAIEKSFLSESSVSLQEILNKFEYTINVLPSINVALRELKDEKYYGCRILDLCENLIMTGSEVTKDVFRKILCHCLKQFYAQTKFWIIHAVLYDPYNEFFIYATGDINISLDSSDCNLTSVGSVHSGRSNNPGLPKYNVNPNNLPNIIPLSVAMQMVFIGEVFMICQHNEIKSKYNDKLLSLCGINEYSIHSQLTAIEENEDFNLKDFSCLIENLWIGVNKYIRQISDEVGNVREQLILMRDIYLIGRGELFQEFLVKGSSILTSDVTSVDSRIINKVFKDAVYYVYLTESSDLTDQFFFKLPHKRALMRGSTTWSQMELKCKIKWPLHYLFTPDIINTYNKLFCFLLRLKKAQIDTTAWKNIITIRNHSLRMKLIEVRMYLYSVVGNLQNYCFTNVIATEMTILLDSVKNTSMFTDLNKALSLFLTNICNNLFLPDIGVTNISNCEKSNLTSLDTVNKCFRSIFALCGLFSELNGKSDDYVFKKLTSIKLRLECILKRLFSILQKIDKTYYCDSSNPTYSLMMCLDYNNFFQNKFQLDHSD